MSRSKYPRVSLLDFGGRIQPIITTALFVEIRLRLLEKAAEMRDRGQIVRAQQIVDVANWFKNGIEAIEEHGVQRRPGLRQYPPAHRPARIKTGRA